MPKKFIILHHSMTARNRTTFAAVDRYHERLWNFRSRLGHYIGYHYFIAGDGKVTQGRVDGEPGAHCRQENMNKIGLGICLAGNFDFEYPSIRQLIALKVLLNKLMKRHGIAAGNLKYHRDYATHKSCPGRNISDDFFKRLLCGNYFVRLEREKDDDKIWAVDYLDARYYVEDLVILRRGLELGFWNGNIDIVT